MGFSIALEGGNNLKISEFAKRTGVTVKTLLHYDKIGLLKPSKKTDAGYRVYGEEDILRLQQISTLKFIGLPLNEIHHILYESGENLERMISIQKKALEEKQKHIESVVRVFNKAENQIKENGSLKVDQLIDIIKITNIEGSVKDQYKTVENLALRTNLHSYNTNKVDWNHWCFQHMDLPDKANILELGCGTGSFWEKNSKNINENWKITLSDSSTAMLESAKKRVEPLEHPFSFEAFDAQTIPYEEESFDAVIAMHMLYLVPDIEKVLSEVKRVLAKGGTFYTTTNASDTMAELNKLMEAFDPKLGMHNNGMCARFEFENGKQLLEKYFSEVTVEVLEGKIVVDKAEPIVSYKASTIKGSSILVGEKKEEFRRFIEDYIKKNGEITITTKACIFKAKK